MAPRYDGSPGCVQPPNAIDQSYCEFDTLIAPGTSASPSQVAPTQHAGFAAVKRAPVAPIGPLMKMCTCTIGGLSGSTMAQADISRSAYISILSWAKTGTA